MFSKGCVFTFYSDRKFRVGQLGLGVGEEDSNAPGSQGFLRSDYRRSTSKIDFSAVIKAMTINRMGRFMPVLISLADWAVPQRERSFRIATECLTKVGDAIVA